MGVKSVWTDLELDSMAGFVSAAMNLLLSQSTEVSRTVENDEVFRKGPVP
jgi:hypothetical protein